MGRSAQFPACSSWPRRPGSSGGEDGSVAVYPTGEPCLPNATRSQQIKRLVRRKPAAADRLQPARVCRFVPADVGHVSPKAFRELRAGNRCRRRPVTHCGGVRNRKRSILEHGDARAGGVLSKTFGMNGRGVVDGLPETDSESTRE